MIMTKSNKTLTCNSYHYYNAVLTTHNSIIIMVIIIHDFIIVVIFNCDLFLFFCAHDKNLMWTIIEHFLQNLMSSLPDASPLLCSLYTIIIGFTRAYYNY